MCRDLVRIYLRLNREREVYSFLLLKRYIPIDVRELLFLLERNLLMQINPKFTQQEQQFLASIKLRTQFLQDPEGGIVAKCIIKYNNRQLTFKHYPTAAEIKEGRVHLRNALYTLGNFVYMIEDTDEDTSEFIENMGLSIDSHEDYLKAETLYEQYLRYVDGLDRLFNYHELEFIMKLYRLMRGNAL